MGQTALPAPVRLQTTPDMMQPDEPASRAIWQQMANPMRRMLVYLFYLSIMAGLGIFLGIVVIYLPGPLLPPVSFLQATVGVLLCLYVAVALHELGHAAAGKWAGYHLIYLVVGPLRLGREVAGWRLRFLSRGLFSFGGWAYGVPTVWSGWRWRRLLFIAGGPLASLVLLLAVVGLRFAWRDTAVAPSLALFIHFMTFAAIAVLPFSFIPLAVRGIRNDALLFIDTLQAGDEALRRQRAIGWLFAQSYRGTRPADIDADILADALEPADGSEEELLATIWGYYQAMDKQRPVTAATYLDRALNLLRQRPQPALAALCFMDAAFFESRYGQRPDVATDWLALVNLPQVSQATNAVEMELVYRRSRAAVAWAKGERETTRLEAEKGLHLLPRLVDRGGAKIEREWLEKLINCAG
jgi:hypothetical protein